MSYRFFRKWTYAVIFLCLFFVYQMFFSNLTRFTIACSYFTNITLMIFVWLHGWESYRKEIRGLENELRENTIRLNDLMSRRVQLQTNNEREANRNG